MLRTGRSALQYVLCRACYARRQQQLQPQDSLNINICNRKSL